MAKPVSTSKGTLPAWLSEPITPARYDVLPAICRRCRNTRKVSEQVVNGLVVATTGRTVPCPDC